MRMVELAKQLREMADVKASVLYSKRKTLNEAADLIDRLLYPLCDGEEMKHIPDDIMRKAQEVYRESQRGSYLMPIAEAMTAERKRCVTWLEDAGWAEAADALRMWARV